MHLPLYARTLSGFLGAALPSSSAEISAARLKFESQLQTSTWFRRIEPRFDEIGNEIAPERTSGVATKRGKFITASVELAAAAARTKPFLAARQIGTPVFGSMVQAL